VTSFKAPSGIVSAEICPDSGELAGATCPDARQEFFIRGSEPTAECQLHSVVAGDPNAASPSHPTPVALQTVDH